VHKHLHAISTGHALCGITNPCGTLASAVSHGKLATETNLGYEVNKGQSYSH